MSLSLFFGLLVLFLQGLNSYAFKSRILDGKSAKITDFPYLVSIQDLYGSSHHCGGIIIGPYHVLTAAHCVDGFEPGEFRIVSGTDDWTKPDAIHYPAYLVPHERFNIVDTWFNDIALINVTKPFIFSSSTSPARLPSRNAKLGNGTRGIAIGFGRSSEHSSPSKTLLQTELTVRDVAYCNQKYKKTYFKDTQICTQGANNAAIYKGDSGGPFIVNGTVFGIAITGMPKFPSAFTKISKYIDWINVHRK